MRNHLNFECQRLTLPQGSFNGGARLWLDRATLWLALLLTARTAMEDKISCQVSSRSLLC